MAHSIFSILIGSCMHSNTFIFANKTNCLYFNQSVFFFFSLQALHKCIAYRALWPTLHIYQSHHNDQYDIAKLNPIPRSSRAELALFPFYSTVQPVHLPSPTRFFSQLQLNLIISIVEHRKQPKGCLQKRYYLDREIAPISSDTPTVSEHLESEYWWIFLPSYRLEWIIAEFDIRIGILSRED